MGHGISRRLGLAAHDTDEDLVTHGPDGEQEALGETLHRQYIDQSLRGDHHTVKPFMKGSVRQDSPVCRSPVGPAPPIKAKDKMRMKMNRMILTKDPMHCSQAKAVLGRKKTTKQMTRKMVTTFD